jgi:hypothetical protein
MSPRGCLCSSASSFLSSLMASALPSSARSLVNSLWPPGFKVQGRLLSWRLGAKLEVCPASAESRNGAGARLAMGS